MSEKKAVPKASIYLLRVYVLFAHQKKSNFPKVAIHSLRVWVAF